MKDQGVKLIIFAASLLLREVLNVFVIHRLVIPHFNDKKYVVHSNLLYFLQGIVESGRGGGMLSASCKYV